MNSKKSNPRGQALVLIALAIVGLVGFTALAIDGGNVFADRRHSQNASDTAAFAAALARVRGDTQWKQVGMNRAEDNSYNNDADSTVEVYLCSESGATCTGLPAGADPSEYIQVRITSIVKMFFAPVVGRHQVTNHTDAIVRASVPKITPWFDGNALVSIMEGCKPTGYPNDPFTIGGNALTVINGSGVFVNSNCSNAFTVNGASSSTIVSDGGICVVGGATYNPSTVDPDPTTGCGTPVDPDKYQLPNPTCSQNGQITEVSSKNYVASPGNYNSTFPNVSPSGLLKLQKGIYCFNNGLSLQGTWDIRTDLNDNGVHDSATEGVLFYVPGGNITFNGTSDVNIHAINTTDGGFPERLLNYLIYVPPTNKCTIKITGDDGSNFTGTILAPACHVTLEGSGGTIAVDSQIIGYSVNIGGSGNLNLTFNNNNNAVTTINPGLSMIK
jgi:hypothetical protein